MFDEEMLKEIYECVVQLYTTSADDDVQMYDTPDDDVQMYDTPDDITNVVQVYDKPEERQIDLNT